MIKTLTRVEGGYALVLDEALMAAADIRPDMPLEIVADGHALRIAPAAADGKAARLAEASRAMHERYAETFRILAR